MQRDDHNTVYMILFLLCRERGNEQMELIGVGWEQGRTGRVAGEARLMRSGTE